MKPLVYKVRVRGKSRWRVDYQELGQRRRTLFPNQMAAENFAKQAATGIKSARNLWARMKEAERERIIMAHYERASRPDGEAKIPSLAAVIAELLQVKKASGRDDGYLKILKLVLNQFAKGREALAIDAVGLHDLESFLGSKRLAYRSTLRARLSGLFAFAVRRGYRTDNPCARLEPVTYSKPPPQVFEPAEFAEAMKWLRNHAPHGLAWFVLSTCCGLRPQEAEQTTRADVHVKEKFVKVEGQTSKVRQRRVVYPRPEAVALLAAVMKPSRMPLPSQSRRRILRALRAQLGWEVWPKDVTRHTAATYWLAIGESVVTVAAMLGNSERVLQRDYKAIKTRKEAREFWRVVKQVTTPARLIQGQRHHR